MSNESIEEHRRKMKEKQDKTLSEFQELYINSSGMFKEIDRVDKKKPKEVKKCSVTNVKTGTT